jgi:hypothetical protein
MTPNPHREAGEQMRGPFGNALPETTATAESLRAKVQRAVKRGTGCRLTAEEAWTLDFMEGDGDWWNAERGAS